MEQVKESVGALEWSDTAPAYAEKVAELYQWSANFGDYAPFRKFLDLINYAETAYGDDDLKFSSWRKPSESLGYVELGLLAGALDQYSDRPLDVDKWLMELLEIESEVGL
jgi:hypothetical protein